MGFPSPAADYTEQRISLDALCNTNRPSVYYFKAGHRSYQAGINKGALLIVNSSIKPADGSIIAARLNGEFRLVRYRTNPVPYLEELDHPERRLPLTADELDNEEGGVCFGVITHVLNDVRVLKDNH